MIFKILRLFDFSSLKVAPSLIGIRAIEIIEVKISKTDWYYLIEEEERDYIYTKPTPKKIKIITLMIVKELPKEIKEQIRARLSHIIMRMKMKNIAVMGPTQEIESLNFNVDVIDNGHIFHYNEEKMWLKRALIDKLIMGSLKEEYICEKFIKECENEDIMLYCKNHENHGTYN